MSVPGSVPGDKKSRPTPRSAIFPQFPLDISPLRSQIRLPSRFPSGTDEDFFQFLCSSAVERVAVNH